MKTIFKSLLVLAAMAAVGLAAAATGMPDPMRDLGLPALAQLSDSQLALLGFGGLVINRGNLTILNQAFNAAFKSGVGMVKPLWNEVAMRVPSTTGEEKYGWLGTTTRFREWIGDRQFQNLKLHDYTIKNKTFENTVGVPREAVEDDQYGVYTPLMTQLGQDAALHPDELVYGLVAAGFASTCYDGQYFFDTDHPVGTDNVASVSNFQGGAGTAWYLLDTTKAIKPFILQMRRDYGFVSKTAISDDNVFLGNEFVYGVDGRLNVGYGLWQLGYASKQTLDTTNYAAARAAMMNFKSDGGKPLNVTPNVLLVPPSLEKAALDMVQAERLANGATNTYRNTARVVVAPWLA